MTVINKDLIQSYILTTAKYDFSVYEKRVLYRLVEMAQKEVQGIHFNDSCRKIEHNLWNFIDVTMPIADLLNGEEDKNYTRIKNALVSLQKKTFQYEDDEIWESISLVVSPRIKKRASLVSLTLEPRIWNAILDFTKGYRKYELETAMSFKSVYSMRFYELMSGQKTPLCYGYEELKEMFGVQDKYKRVNDFIRYVIEPAKKELDVNSPYSFEYTPMKTGKRITGFKFFPIYHPEHRDSDLEKKNLQKRVSASYYLTRSVRSYLKNDLEFSDKEIKNNLDLFLLAQDRIEDFTLVLSTLKGKSRDKKNPKGYIIRSIQCKLNDIK